MTSEAEVDWLSDDEQRTWVSFAQAMVRLPSELESRLQRDADLGHFEYVVLACLSMADDQRLRLSDLARVAGSSLTRLSNVVTKFERRDWIRREPDPRDRRATVAVLTSEGLKKVESAAPFHVRHVRSLVFDHLSQSQQHALRDAMQVIMGVIDPAPPIRSLRP